MVAGDVAAAALVRESSLICRSVVISSSTVRISDELICFLCHDIFQFVFFSFQQETHSKLIKIAPAPEIRQNEQLLRRFSLQVVDASFPETPQHEVRSPRKSFMRGSLISPIRHIQHLHPPLDSIHNFNLNPLTKRARNQICCGELMESRQASR